MNQVNSEIDFATTTLNSLNKSRGLNSEQKKYIATLVSIRRAQVEEQAREQEKLRAQVRQTIKHGLSNLRKQNVLERDAGGTKVTRLPWGGSTRISQVCLLYTSPSPRDGLLSRMPSSA